MSVHTVLLYIPSNKSDLLNRLILSVPFILVLYAFDLLIYRLFLRPGLTYIHNINEYRLSNNNNNDREAGSESKKRRATSSLIKKTNHFTESSD